MMIVFKHFLRKKITKMKSYRNLALVNFLNYVKMKKLFSLMNSNQLFFHQIIFFLSSNLGFGTKRVLVFKPVGEKELRGMHHIATSMKRWFSDVKKDLWKYRLNCTNKAPETKYSIKKCHSNRKKGCSSYLATRYGWLIQSCKEYIRDRKINSRFYYTWFL